jgi:hypothetical protein
MSFEEWQSITRLMLDFYALSKQQQDQILLMIDGLKYRSEHGTET